MSSLDAPASPVAASVAPDSRAAFWFKIERRAFWLCVFVAGGMMWLAPQLPMIDLPQHAGQIALWRDLLKGVSPWSDLVRINLATPYLIGYGAALPLSFVVSPETAIAIVLTLAFYAFVAGSVALRKEIAGDERLDWLFIPSFFGFCWKWGFYTFLTAAPLLLFFLLCALRYRMAPSRGRAVGLFALGLALLFAHGLAFLFGLLAAGLLLIGPRREPLARRIRRLAPLLGLGVALVIFTLGTQQHGTAAHYDGLTYGTPLWLRPLSALMFTVTDNWDPDLPLLILMVVALLTPFFIGARWNRGPAVVLMTAWALVYFIVPAEAFETGYLFARFALFLPLFFALCFRPGQPPAESRAPPALGSEAPARLAMIVACLAILVTQAWRVHAFAIESAGFATIEKAAAPGRRALGVIFDARSAAAHADKAYAAWYAWYQADRGGFVDYNFADLPPQVIRFKPGRRPLIGLDYVSDIQTLDWRTQHGWVYDYFFVRAAPDALGWLTAKSAVSGPPCRFSIAASDGPWTLVRRDACPPGPSETEN